MVYRESSSEDEGVGGGKLPSEVIEIDDDDDDDVIAVGCCELCSCIVGTFPSDCYCNMDVVMFSSKHLCVC